MVSEVVGELFYYFPDEDFHGFWYSKEDHFKKANSFLSKLEKLINERKEELFRDKKFDSYFAKAAQSHGVSEEAGTNYISISRRFGVNPFGDVGLSHWEEINPKTIRGKAYLILKKKEAPVHFRDISDAINEAEFDERKAYPQTVHNELIKDPRFVLVGRGIYGLTEQGFNPGATHEIIKVILKKSGPLPFRDIVSSVSKQRFLKDNTILLNLQNKKHFKKLSDGRYSLLK
jgi:DNA-directed RNA polymerase delta subunit